MILFAPARKESAFCYDGPGERPSSTSLDRFHGRQVFVREIQELTGVRVRDLRNLVAVLPNSFPPLPLVRDARCRTEIHAQDFVLNQKKANFAHRIKRFERRAIGLIR